MTREQLIDQFGEEGSMCNVGWSDLSKDLQEFAERWVQQWFDKTQTKNLLETSGFHDMSVGEFISFAIGEEQEDKYRF